MDPPASERFQETAWPQDAAALITPRAVMPPSKVWERLERQNCALAQCLFGRMIPLLDALESELAVAEDGARSRPLAAWAGRLHAALHESRRIALRPLPHASGPMDAREATAPARRRRQLMGLLFHDLLTPLFSVAICLENQSSGKDPLARQWMLGQARRLGRRLKLACPRELLGQAQAPERGPLALMPYLKNLRGGFEGALSAKGLRLYLDGPPGLAVATVADALGDAVLAPLLDNAIQCTAAGGAVLLRAAAADGWVCLQILDQGPGFGAAALEALRAGMPVGREGSSAQGSGFGLALAQAFAGHLGGRLEFRDRAEGGAEAALWLPPAPHV